MCLVVYDVVHRVQNTSLVELLQQAYGARKVVALNGTVSTTFENHREGQTVCLLL